MSAASSGLAGAAEGARDAELRAGLVERAVGLGAAVSLGTRPPYQSEVVPSSPFLV